MKRYKAHIGYISPPRDSPRTLLGEIDAPNAEAAIDKGYEMARERDLRGTVQVSPA